MKTTDDTFDVDVAILGAGAAGLATALHLPPSHRVAIVDRGAPGPGGSDWAQGGIAAAIDDADSIDDHTSDTVGAGAGLCDAARARSIISEGQSAVEALARYGLGFTEDAAPASGGETHGGLQRAHLTREGGHRRRRVLHVGDATGAAMMRVLRRQVAEHANITVLEQHQVLDLVINDSPGTPRRCVGAHLLDLGAGGVTVIRARAVVLATGGAGALYAHTSTPPSALGSGIALAWRAGCRVANLEFTQFHPTCLARADGARPLLSEALRGEGGILVDETGRRFMPDYHADAELAPRDVVARAIVAEMDRRTQPHMFLDVSHLGSATIARRFPTLARTVREAGYDLVAGPVPVVPAAHYTCGGIVVDDTGRTDLAGLYAVGETAHTGLHGANRLASNSLLECLVTGTRTARALAHESLPAIASSDLHPQIPRPNPAATDVVGALVRELRALMWREVGILRHDAGLDHARDALLAMSRRWRTTLAEVDAAAGVASAQATALSEAADLEVQLTVALLIVESARRRRESRGAHFNRDHPHVDPGLAMDTILDPARCSIPAHVSMRALAPRRRHAG
mgnify:CR=1 FL=1